MTINCLSFALTSALYKVGRGDHSGSLVSRWIERGLEGVFGDNVVRKLMTRNTASKSIQRRLMNVFAA